MVPAVLSSRSSTHQLSCGSPVCPSHRNLLVSMLSLAGLGACVSFPEVLAAAILESNWQAAFFQLNRGRPESTCERCKGCILQGICGSESLQRLLWGSDSHKCVEHALQLAQRSTQTIRPFHLRLTTSSWASAIEVQHAPPVFGRVPRQQFVSHLAWLTRVAAVMLPGGTALSSLASAISA